MRFCVREERIWKLKKPKDNARGRPAGACDRTRLRWHREDRYVFDTSALICYIENEDGAEVVDELLRKGEEQEALLFVPFVSFTEVYYITWQKKGKELAQNRIALINYLAIERVESDEQLSLIAGEFKAKKRISFADAWVAAVAKVKDAVLVHKDPEFEQLESEIKALKLPYKGK